jgi:serine/threonine protein kinase
MPIVPLSPGQHLNADAHAPGGGRFRIEKPLSAGGFAITYLAHDQQFDDRCVIKELAIDQLMVRSGTEMVPLPGREADVAVWVQKVQKEAQTLHRLRNAGVVPIRATWRELGTAYFAMDFIDGIELPSEPSPSATWATWEPVALKFLAALGAIHAEGLVHGDIKPQNVLVSREGNPVIIDFGTARSTEEAKKTRLTTVAMTPGYCPPELAVRDRAREMGPWSDLYSWALTVMGLVIRHRGIDGAPLDTSARVALAQHGLAEAGMGAETASALREAAVPEPWIAVLMACVALEPSARPQSAAAVLAGIQAAPVARAIMRPPRAAAPLAPQQTQSGTLKKVLLIAGGVLFIGALVYLRAAAENTELVNQDIRAAMYDPTEENIGVARHSDDWIRHTEYAPYYLLSGIWEDRREFELFLVKTKTEGVAP